MRLQGHTMGASHLAVSPDGRILASGSMDKTIRLWSLPDGKLLQTLEGHTGQINDLAFRQDGGLLVSGSGDATIRLWKLCHKDSLENQSIGLGVQDPLEIDAEKMASISIFAAVVEGNVSEVKRHLEAGMSPNATTGQWHETPLIVAAGAGRLEVVKLLIDMGADVNIADEIGSVPISAASSRGHVEVVRYLVDKGALYHSPEIGLHPIADAAHNGQLAVVKYLVEEKRVPAKGRTMHGEPPLHSAAGNAHIEVVQYLMEHGADPYEPDSFRNTAFATVEGCMQLNGVTEADKEKYRLILEVLQRENTKDERIASRDPRIASRDPIRWYHVFFAIFVPLIALPWGIVNLVRKKRRSGLLLIVIPIVIPIILLLVSAIAGIVSRLIAA